MMRRFLFSVLLSSPFCLLHAQTPDSIITAPPPGSFISNRARNIFLSEAAGYYLSSVDNLTLYKNSVVMDAADGTLAIYHNLRQPTGQDSRLSSFFSIGTRADFADAYASAHTGRPYNNRFGLLLKQTWIGKGSLTADLAQRQTINALRSGLAHSMQLEIKKKMEGFGASLLQWDSAQDVPGQGLQAAKEMARQQFLADLAAEYEFAYARRQSEILHRNFLYRQFSTHWTSISTYLPLITENFHTAPKLADAPDNRHAWPLQVNVSHTRLWMGSHYGRIMLTLAGDLLLNNSRDAFGLDRYSDMDLTYVGGYKSFLTPALQFNAVYFPVNSHIGISGCIRQRLGDLHRTDAVIGLPVVLIDKKVYPAIDFEFQVRFFDIGDQLAPRKGIPGKTSIGLTAGIPFSRIAF